MEVRNCLKNWDGHGKNSLFALLKSETGDDSFTSHSALHELLHGFLEGEIKRSKLLEVLKDVVEYSKDLAYILGDIFNLFDMEVTCSDNKARLDELHSLIQGCVDFVPDTVLKQTLEAETLAKIGLISNKKNFDTKYVRIKTRMYYKQQKFNLLREESEGYAKLIVELQQDFHSIDVEYLKKITQSLIGYFNLDPNRVLDLMLEMLECRPEEWPVITELIRHQKGPTDTLTHLIGFKFKSYKAQRETPACLYRTLALLVDADLVDFDLIYTNLNPSDAQMVTQQQKVLEEAERYARKMNTVVLSDKKDKDDDAQQDDSTAQMIECNNQKLGLCQALLEIGSLERATELFYRFPSYFAIAHPAMVKTLSNLLYNLTAELYSKYSGLPAVLLKPAPCPPTPLLPLPTVSDVTGFERHVVPILHMIGPCIAADPVLMARVTRICNNLLLLERPSGANAGLGSIEPSPGSLGLLSALDSSLLPALSLLQNNCCLSDELWSIVKLLPYTHRYNLYGRWKNQSMSQHPQLIRARAKCLERAKYLMKRLTKENVKQSGRHLGKISHCNPGVVFDCMLTQIQRYDNLIAPVVESLKYLSSMSYDVLTFCLIEALSSPEKERMKTEETNISLWLSSLANFAGLAYRKYSVDLTGLIQYVLNQLKMGKSYDLAVLREVVQKMSGIEIADEITDDQLGALSGGELLKIEGAYFAIIRNTKRSSGRLKEALLTQELAVPACLLIAQQRDSILYRETSNKTHVKLVAKLYDQCQDTLEQLGTFLASQLSAEEFSRRIPPVNELILTYHVPTDAAFFLLRPCLNYAIQAKFDEARREREKSLAKKLNSEQKTAKYLEAVDAVMTPVVNAILPTKDPKIWDDLNTSFFVTFWSLSTYDLEVPRDAYSKQIRKMEQAKQEAERNKDLHANKKKKELDRCQSLIERLTEEREKQIEHTKRVTARLTQQKDQWFPSTITKTELVTQFLQHCVFPRCCFTMPDAVYCAKFIHTLHQLRTANFSTLILVDRIFNDITFTMTSCSENEVARYARFLNAVLDIVMRWHGSEEVFGKECVGFPGFVTMIRKGSDNPQNNQIDFENFRHVCHKWHFRTTKAMASCLDSKNYIQIRNALVVLTKIQTHFPRIFNYAQAIERRVDRVAQDEKTKRPDLYALAVGYSGQLKQRRSSWVKEGDFHIIKDKEMRKDDAKNRSDKKTTANKAASGKSANARPTGKDEPRVKDEQGIKEEVKQEPRQGKRAEAAQANGKDPAEPAPKKSRDSGGKARAEESRTDATRLDDARGDLGPNTFGPAKPPVIKQEPTEDAKNKERRREKKSDPEAGRDDPTTPTRQVSSDNSPQVTEGKRRKADTASERVEHSAGKKPKRSESAEEKRERKRFEQNTEATESSKRHKHEEARAARANGDGDKVHKSRRTQEEKAQADGEDSRRSSRERSNKKKKSL